MPTEGDAHPDTWRTPSGFEALQDQRWELLLGRTRLTLNAPQFHIHQINAVTSPHAHPDHQILYYMKGAGRQIIGEESFRVTPQTAFFIPPNRIHHFHPARRGHAEVFTLQLAMDVTTTAEGDVASGQEDAAFARLAKLLYSESFMRIRLRTEEIREAEEQIHAIQNELTQQAFGYRLSVKGRLLLLLRLFLKAGIEKEEGAKPLPRTQLVFWQATGLIRRQMQTPLTLGEVANHCHVSTSYLQKIFRQYAGESFSRYLQNAKMDHAAHLLAVTDLSVKEIAQRCGVADRNYFTRLFRKIIGMSPREYRHR